MLKSLAALAHSKTEQTFAHYGHIFFFAPMAIDHIGTLYGQINAALLCAYAVAAFCARNSDA